MAPGTESTLGWAYIGLSVAWTVILGSGMGFLYFHRQLPFLQNRRLPLVFSAITLLHIYSVAVMVSYTIGPLITCVGQFWIMSIELPLGMALLQAANSHFQTVASQQRRYAQFSNLEDHVFSRKPKQVDPFMSLWKRVLERIRSADKTTRTVIYISIGMILQVALTFFVYFGSEIFHPSYGIFNVQVPGTEQQRAVLCLTGWEWWLSIFWQFFWAWVFAPYMLWKTRNIHDSQGWRVQTICCCIAGLPATPLWLAALYSPQMAPVNAVIVPAQWFSISIFFISVSMIFPPCWQVFKTHSLQQETLDAIASWEQRHKGRYRDHESISSAALSSSTVAGSLGVKSTKTRASGNSSDSRRSDTLTMVALEAALHSNPQPLLEFAALKDFSGENISFLSHVADWNRAWRVSVVDPSQDHELFIRAVRMYSHFVSMEYSEFPVNLSSRAAKDLHDVFSGAAHRLARPSSVHSDSATPFDEPFDSSTTNLKDGLALHDTLGQANLTSVTRMVALNGEGYLDIPIPETFNPRVFDAAEGEVKYLVLTNTWPKFVHAGFDNASQAAQRDEHHLFDGARKYFCGLERLV